MIWPLFYEPDFEALDKWLPPNGFAVGTIAELHCNNHTVQDLELTAIERVKFIVKHIFNTDKNYDRTSLNPWPFTYFNNVLTLSDVPDVGKLQVRIKWLK